MRLVMCIHGNERYRMKEHDYYYICPMCKRPIGKIIAHRRTKDKAAVVTWVRNWRGWWTREF